MMDSEAMTGGCHFTWECENYKNNCGKCPGINSRNEKDKTFRNIIQKKDIFQSIDIQPIYVTELQKQMLSESFIFKNIKSFKAYIPVDENKYLKNTKYKQKYGLPENKKLIFFAANEIDDERKGMRFLYNALNILNDKLPITKKEKILLIVAGNRFEKINIKLPFDYVHLGYLSQISFAEVMCSSDIFICPSIEDTGPMVINQSLMCGTPVVAFNMGVAKDFIKNGVTGYKAEIRNENELANGIYSLLIMPTNELKLISKNCRETALKNFSLNSVLNQFNEILNSIN
jgi:glycosyltransferase involved in cell wall biosynthesis